MGKFGNLGMGDTVLQWAASATPGVLALIGAAVGYGRLTQRLVTVERDVRDLKTIATDVAVIGERTKNMAESTNAIQQSVNSITSYLLEEKRPFMSPEPSRRRQG